MGWIASGLATVGVVVAAAIAYKGTRDKTTQDRAAALFAQASGLKDDYREAYEEVKAELEKLRAEVSSLRTEVRQLIREGEMWRGVAVEAFHDHHFDHDGPPSWWPSSEPYPERNLT